MPNKNRLFQETPTAYTTENTLCFASFSSQLFSYLEANIVVQAKEQGRLNTHIISENVLMLSTENYQY